MPQTVLGNTIWVVAQSHATVGLRAYHHIGLWTRTRSGAGAGAGTRAGAGAGTSAEDGSGDRPG